MKNFKQTIKNICIVFSILFIGGNITAQPIMVTSGQTYNICEGSNATFQVTPSSGDWISDPTSWEFGPSNTTCPSPYGCSIDNYTVNTFNYTWLSGCYGGVNSYYQVSIKPNALNSIAVTVVQHICSSGSTDPSNITFTITPYSTSISGTADFCHTSNETYTCSTNVPGVGTNGYTWTLPSFLSGTSTTNTDATTTTGSGTGNISVVVSGSPGCPSGSTSNNGALALTSHSGAPAQPSGSLTMRQTGNSCQFDAHISAVTGATSYIWSLSPTMSPTILSNGITTYPYGDFDYSTTYSVYVEASNSCGTSAANYWNPTTPGKPPGCQSSPIKPGEPIEGYKVYPNPANNQVTIEYPANNSGSDMTLSLYDIAGHKIANWNLPSAETKVNENTSKFSTGIYMYIISSGEDVLMKGKILIQR